MREIKFKGKSLIDGRWLFGDLIHNAFDGTREWPVAIKEDGLYPEPVHPETVGEYIGQKDKNEKDIIKPIRNDIDYYSALEIIDKYFDAEEGTKEADYRDVLVVLIEKYEDENYSIDLPDPISAIKFRMEQKGLTKNKKICT